MVTEFDLHERTGVPVAAIRQWLRQHGFGGRAGQRVPPAVERRFLEAHGGPGDQRELLAERTTRPLTEVRRMAPVAAPPPPTPEAPAVPERMTVAMDDSARRVRDLLQRIGSLEAENAELRADREAARQAARDARQEVREAQAAAAPVVETLPTLGEALGRRGLKGRQAVDGLRTLAEAHGEALLAGLAVQDATILDSVRPVCAVITCREVAEGRGYLVVPAGGTACHVCKGSDNRRWFRRMALQLTRAGRRRLLVVGGAADSRAEFDRLAREEPDLKVHLVGEDRVDGTRARALVRGADVVAFWVSTELSHADSQPFKDAARQDPTVVIAASPPGGRGVAALARAVVEAVETQAAKAAGLPRDVR
ncbi:MAG: hypothetical protein H6706_26135 [Myxococcales bacterium]|nr:hypothetical protein [Myxococcales bacterium]